MEILGTKRFIYSQRILIGYNIELAELVFSAEYGSKVLLLFGASSKITGFVTCFILDARRGCTKSITSSTRLAAFHSKQINCLRLPQIFSVDENCIYD